MILRNKVKLAFILIVALQLSLNAGNPDRIGQAGAFELLINPWARSSGLHDLNTASVRGIEAMNSNIGGLSFTRKTEFVFSRTAYLKGTDININALGVSQLVGKSGVLGISIMSMNFGDIPITTTDIPDGDIGTFSPQFINIGLAYSKTFSNSIHGGLALRAISESISDVKAQGACLDAGIQYVTGSTDNIKFGIALRNIGMPMRYSGDGLVFRTSLPSDKSKDFSSENRSQSFELPSLLNIGGAYDFKFKELHRVTLIGNYTSNSFSRDQIGGGVEYAFREIFMARVGYRHEKKDDETKSAITGFSAGFTFELPIKKDGPTFGLDYSYKATNPFQGIHSFGARINL